FLLCLRRERSTLEVQRVVKDQEVPGEPKQNSQAAHAGVDDQISLDTCAMVTPQQTDDRDKNQNGYKEEPAIIASQCAEECSACCEDEVFCSVRLCPGDEVVTCSRQSRYQNQLTEWCTLQVENIRIQSKDQRTDKTGNAVLRQATGRKKDVDGSN